MLGFYTTYQSPVKPGCRNQWADIPYLYTGRNFGATFGFNVTHFSSRQVQIPMWIYLILTHMTGLLKKFMLVLEFTKGFIREDLEEI